MSYPQSTFVHTTIVESSFWGRRRQIVRKETLMYQLQQLKNTGRYDAFKLQWHPIYDKDPGIAWPVTLHLFWDSDVAKWIEGACYFLQEKFDADIDAAVKELVTMIGTAQREDGYLNINYQVVQPGKEWTNLRDMHELYNAGHLIEAALIHHLHYKDDKLLAPIQRYVSLIHSVLGPGADQKHGYPGHPEIELALLRLYEATKDLKALELARYFITERGNQTGWDEKPFYVVEAEHRGETMFNRPVWMPEPNGFWYHQAHKSILEQETAEGHSVRAAYLLTAVADLVRIDPKMSKSGYLDACKRLWNNIVDKKMYMTGGIGSQGQWEGFGANYDLPQASDEGGCYAETCAGIGMIMLAQRLLQLELDNRYADVLELCLFNCVLTAMSYDGKAFSYANQLATSEGYLNKRNEWFECACCPPNVTRLFGMLGGYLWTFSSEFDSEPFVNVHLYADATLKFSHGQGIVEITQKTKWPLDGVVEFSATKPESMDLVMRLRIPKWAKSFEIHPKPEHISVDKGYVTLPSSFLSSHREFTLNIDGFQPRFISPHPYTSLNIVAVAKGPLVYCVEDVDNRWVTDHFKSAVLDLRAELKEEKRIDPEVGDEYVAITAVNGGSFLNLDPWEETGSLPRDVRPGLAFTSTIRDLVFVPYYYRANRKGIGHMRVGLRRLN